MKLTSVFMVLSLTLCCFSGIYSKNIGMKLDCTQYMPRGEPDGSTQLACPKVSKQICASDGKTYPSECALCEHNLKYGAVVHKMHDGVCKRQMPPSQYI